MLFLAWWAHVWLLHFFVLGSISVDGFGYRGYALVELLQHGDVGAGRFTDWSLHGYTPFVELANLPFLATLGLRGVMIGLPLAVFPLCVHAVFLCVRELARSERAATLGAIAYCAMPMVNQQPFAGYVDFAVTGLLAYAVYALARLRTAWSARGLVTLAFAVCMFTLSRTQAFYLLCVLAPFVLYALRGLGRRKLLWIAVAVIAGCAPCLALQAYRWIEWGSPVAPAQLELLGMHIGRGATMATYWLNAGLDGADTVSLLRSAVHGWLVHPIWPIGGFYASGSMGAGLMFWFALALAPRALRDATSFERWLLLGGVAASLLSKDYALPRYSYTTMLAMAILVGRGLATARPRLGLALLVVMLLHGLRPEFDMVQLRSGYLGPRMNIGASPFYLRGGNVFIYPSGGYKLAIIDDVSLPLRVYGRDLSNEVLMSIPHGALGASCAGLAEVIRREPNVLFVDEHDATTACSRTCVIHEPVICAAWRIVPGVPSTP